MSLRQTEPSRVARSPRPEATAGPPSRHGPIAQLLIASSPLSLILVAYAVGDWIAGPIDLGRPGTVNRLGFGLHRTGGATVDAHVFGSLPSVRLQEWLVDGSAHWYDAVASLVYVTHFVMIPLVTALVWFRYPARYRSWILAVLTFIVVGVAGYVVLPASPPWLSSQEGLIGPVARISNLGWDYLHLSSLGDVFDSSQAASNPIAAIPSLHAGGAMLITLFCWSVAGRWWRVVLAAYPLLMALALVYTGEHYVVDVAAGWLTAAIAVLVAGVTDRPRSPHPSPSGSGQLLGEAAPGSCG